MTANSNFLEKLGELVQQLKSRADDFVYVANDTEREFNDLFDDPNSSDEEVLDLIN